MSGKMKHTIHGLALSLACISALAEDVRPTDFTIADTRAELAGEWQGKLEYRDYQANRWFGIPVTVVVEPIYDSVTLIRKASFDDGDSGTVYITTISMLAPDGMTEYVGSFRADRPAELGSFSLHLEKDNALDATHWTVIAETEGMDDNRPATIRETTTRNGPTLVTLKEVDYRDDNEEAWLQRNRTVMEKVAK